MKRKLVIWNPAAGATARALSVREALYRRGDVLMIEPQATAQAQQAITKHGAAASLIVAAGGDGTVHNIVNHIWRSGLDVPLLVLPLGTGNDLARGLAIPLEIDEAVYLLDRGGQRQIDLIRLAAGDQTQVVANLATGGNSHQVSEWVTEELKQQWGPLCYVRGALEAISHLQGYQATLQFDDQEPVVVQTWNILAANGRYCGGGMAVAPTANFEDGMIEAIIIRDTKPIDVAVLTPQLVLGKYTEHPAVLRRRVKELRIRSEPPMPFTLDGEHVALDEYDFVVEPRALRVVVGEDYVPALPY